jgi:ABC-type multidrug transport system permease subunit
MRAFLHLLGADARRLLKTPSVPLLWLAFPIALSVIEYGAFGQIGRSASGLPKGELLLVDDDRTLLSSFLAQSLQREPLSDFFTIVPLDSGATVEKKLADNKGSAALRIPAGFQDSVLAASPVQLVYTPNPRQSIRPQMIDASLRMFLEIGNRFLHESRDATAELRAATRVDGPPSRATVLSLAGSFYDAGQRFEKLGAVADLDVTVQRPAPAPGNPAIAGGAPNFFAYFLPGLVVFSVLMVAQGFERRYYELRVRGLHRRITAAPVSTLTVLSAQGAGVLVAGLVVGGVILAAGALLFDIHLTRPLTIAVTLVGFAIFAVGLCKAIYGRARSKRAAETLGSVVTLIMTLVGGGFAPLEIYSESVRPIAAATPVGCASTTLVNAIVHGRSLAESAPYALGTWAWAVVALVIGFALAWRAHART